MRAATKAVLIAWLALVGLTSLPYLVHTLAPPRGTAFRGFFYYDDDHYLYLSYVQQAEDGAFLFRNKLVAADHPPALVNLEWWAVGRLSRGLGRRPFLAYRLVAAAAALALLSAVARLLRQAGVAESRLLPSLLLVGAGSGLGALWLVSGWLPLERCLDVTMGLFPFVGLLANPHFTLATALFLWSLLLFSEETARGQALGVALAAALGLSRPYDLITLVALRLAYVALRHPWREWIPRAAPLVALAPVALWNYWVFYRNPAFAFYAQALYRFPRPDDVALALAPAALPALLAVRACWSEPKAGSMRLLLLLWCGFGAAVVALQPVHFSLQFLVGIGLPILAFAAVGLARFSRAWTWAALLVLGASALHALHVTLQPLGYWFVPREQMESARALSPLCQRGDIVFAPVDISLFAAGLTPCKAYVSHVSHPAYRERLAQVEAFYSGAMDPAVRAALLERGCIRYLVLPGDAGERPLAWLGEGAPFERRALLGAAPRQVSIYGSSAPPGCRP